MTRLNSKIISLTFANLSGAVLDPPVVMTFVQYEVHIRTYHANNEFSDYGYLNNTYYHFNMYNDNG